MRESFVICRHALKRSACELLRSGVLRGGHGRLLYARDEPLFRDRQIHGVFRLRGVILQLFHDAQRLGDGALHLYVLTLRIPFKSRSYRVTTD
jgi:hypothetical protein